MAVYEQLLALESAETPIRVAVVGAGGSMGRGLALQCGITPGVRMVAAVDIDAARAEGAADLHGLPWMRAYSEHDVHAALREGDTVVTSDPSPLIAAGRDAVDVLVEASSSVRAAARTVSAALRAGIDVVLMNAEVDCLLGRLLHATARDAGTIVTSDAGDQHGVLMRMVDEVRLWGFDVEMAGNIKGFLDRAATTVSMADEARRRRLNPAMCVAYTDGTKLNIEMALVANATGLVPLSRGMTGPPADRVDEVFEKFDLDGLPEHGAVDYILGAEPGGGVFVIGRTDAPVQREYLSYYKMGEGPHYLFYRPYHLCHLETIQALASVAIDRRPLFQPLDRPVAEVVAVAKADLHAGGVLGRAIGSDHVYGEIEERTVADALGAVPVCLLDGEGRDRARLTTDVAKREPITWSAVELDDGELLDAYRRQEELLRVGAAVSG